LTSSGETINYVSRQHHGKPKFSPPAPGFSGPRDRDISFEGE
jgi:hypothetical protein